MRISSSGEAALTASWMCVKPALGHSTLSSSTTSRVRWAGKAIGGQTSPETRTTANTKGYSRLLFMGTCLSSYSFGSRAHAGDSALKIASEDTGPSSSTYEIVGAVNLCTLEINRLGNLIAITSTPKRTEASLTNLACFTIKLILPGQLARTTYQECSASLWRLCGHTKFGN